MPSQSEWDSQKDVIRELYLVQNYTLKELRSRMESAGFDATKSQYETKFKAWGFSKNDSNIPAATWKHVGYKMAKRKCAYEDSAVFIDGAEVDNKRVKKEISRHKYLITEQIELESIGAPSPPGPLAIVATPPSSQPVFNVNHWPDNLPWLAFIRSLNNRLNSLRQANEASRSSRRELSSLQSRAQHGVMAPNHNVFALDACQTSRHITTTRQRWDLIQTILPTSSTRHQIAGIQHSMSLLSTTSSHWALKLLIYMASNNFLEFGDLDRIWHLVEETGVKELTTLSQSYHQGEESLKAALEYLFEAGVQANRTDIVSWVLDTGVDPNRRIGPKFDGSLHLPLCMVMSILQWTHTKSMVYLLLSQGASPMKMCSETHKTAAHMVIMDTDVDAETLEMFLQAVTKIQTQERTIRYPKGLRREYGTTFKIPEAQQHMDSVFIRLESLVELLEKSSTSRTTLVSPETLIQAVESNNRRLIEIIHRRGLSMNCHGPGSQTLYQHSFRAQSPLAAAVAIAIGFVPLEISIFSLLLQLGASLNYNQSPNLCSHVLEAAVHCRFAPHRARFVQFLIENGAKVHGDVSCNRQSHQNLMYCALTGDFSTSSEPDEEVVKALHGAGLPFPTESLLWYLKNVGSRLFYRIPDLAELIKTLISETTQWTTQSKNEWTALDYVVQKGMKDVEELMIKKGAVHSRHFIRNYCLHESVQTDKLETLFQRVSTPRNDKQKRTQLFYHIIAILRAEDLCASSLVAPFVRDLLHDYHKLPRSPKHESYIILRACATRDKILIGLTLELFPDICSPAALEGLIWYQTIRTVDYWPLIEELLRRRCNNSSSLWSQDTRIIYRAVHSEMTGKGDPRVLDWFHKNSKEVVELASSHPSSFLMGCLYPPDVAELLNAPTTWTPRDSWQCWKYLNTSRICKFELKASTYLGILAAYTGKVDRMRDLLQHGLRLNRRFSGAPTILHFAIARGDSVMSRQLLDAGADVNARAPWRYIARYIHDSVFDSTYCSYDFSTGPRRGRDALQLAVEQGDLPMIRLLLEFEANVNGPPAPVGGATALQIACIKGYIDIAQLLLQKGADVNAAGALHSGRTALEGAAESGRLEMVFLLLERGCLIQHPSRIQYIRAVGFARAEAHHTVATMLQDYGDWTAEDENFLNHNGLVDTDLENCSSEGSTQEDEEISELDFYESDENVQSRFLSETNSESEVGVDGPTRDDEEASIIEEDISHRTADECRSSELEPATLRRDFWDDLLDYYGDDEAV